MKTIIVVFLCATIAAITLATSETPKECVFGTPEFNETLCNETCTKDEHMSQPYCANFTQPTTPKPTQPPKAVDDKKVEEEVKKEEVQPSEHPAPDQKDSVHKSHAPSLRSSLMFGASCLLLSFL